MHAGTIAEYVIYANQPLCFDVNSSLAYPQIDDESFKPPFIVMIDRGDCTFADKVKKRCPRFFLFRWGKFGYSVALPTRFCKMYFI